MYELQRKEPYTYFTGPGRPTPVHTYRWKGIAICGDKTTLEKMIPEGTKFEYRIEKRPF